MTHAERYLELGLRLGKHVDGLVDAYYGPPEIKEQVDAEETIDAAQLAADADALLAELDDSWLRDQVRGCATYAHVLAGDEISYSDEVERCYGVRPGEDLRGCLRRRARPSSTSCSRATEGSTSGGRRGATGTVVGGIRRSPSSPTCCR